MDIILLSLESTVTIVLPIGATMFICLFGIELLMQIGLMKYLKPIGKPFSKLATLPPESTISFLAGIGSIIAAHTITAGFHGDKKLTERELILTGVLNTVPFHFKQILTFQLPFVLPLLGMELCLIYIAAFWLTGLIKLIFVVLVGKFTLPKGYKSDKLFYPVENETSQPVTSKHPKFQLLKDTWNTRKKMFFRMISILFIVTYIVQILMNTGTLKWFERIIIPMTNLFNLPAAVVGPISVYVFSPTVGITYMSNLLNQNIVSSYQAIVALLSGSLLMIPVSRLRRSLPRYISIFGLKNGAIICGITTVLSLLSRVLILIWVVIFF